MSAVIIVTEAIGAVEQAAEAYARIRALAVQVGATDEQLAQADARFARIVSDPLPPAPVHDPAPPPPPPDPSSVEYDTKEEAIAHLAPAQGFTVVVQSKTDGKFIVANPAFQPLPGEQVYP